MTASASPPPGLLVRARFGYRALTAWARTLPDFLILGAQKGGTTSLHRYLEQHPAVLAAATKEIHYFSFDWRRGEAWYRSHFPTALRRRLGRLRQGIPVQAGEASPYYLLHPLAPRRAHATVPGARLIAILRDPVSRAHAHFHHNRRWGVEDCASLAEAVEREPERLAGERERILADDGYESFAYRHHSYLARGLYAEQLRAWLERYPREQLLVLESGELSRDTAGAYRRVLDFLGLPPWEPAEYVRHNRTGSPPLDPELRERLAAWFEPHNRALYELLGRDLGWERAS